MLATFTISSELTDDGVSEWKPSWGIHCGYFALENKKSEY